MPSGCGGNTLGPPILRLSSPLAASTRRAPSPLPSGTGARARAAGCTDRVPRAHGVAADDCRYVADSTISLVNRSSCASPAARTRSRASRAAPGCDGGAALRAEVFARFDDAAAEELFPRAIDRDARGQGVLARRPASAPDRGGSASGRRGSGWQRWPERRRRHASPLSMKLPRRRT